MFGFKVMGAGYRPHLVSTCLRKIAPGQSGQKAAGHIWGVGYAIDWVGGAAYRARLDTALGQERR